METGTVKMSLQDPNMALTKLQGLEGEQQGVILYLLANALNNFNRSAVSQEEVEIFLEVSLNIIAQCFPNWFLTIMYRVSTESMRAMEKPTIGLVN